ncbi:hypothetical protein LLB_1803 [Legionella longbeachae D-4968]|nr:hypothetical protein LLB_1803 [Legionella longbeachae D-4968]
MSFFVLFRCLTELKRYQHYNKNYLFLSHMIEFFISSTGQGN